MYCKYCGKEIDDNSKFCNYCGKEVIKVDVCPIPKEAIQRTIDAITNYDWNESVELAKKRYPKADAIKFRMCFRTNTFDLRYDYDNFLCLDSEKDVKECVVNYLTDIMEGRTQIPKDFELDIYVSTDAFISKDHDENDEVFYSSDIIDGDCYDDADGNSWITISCVQWMLGCDSPVDSFWSMLGLGLNPDNMVKIEPSDLF